MLLNVIFLSLIALLSSPDVNTDEPIAPFAEKFELVWSDEFNYEGLPDYNKWNHEVGFIRNKEAQYYTEKRVKNAEVKDGKLHIRGIKEKYKGADYTSASLNTKGKHNFTYGRIEVKAKIPHGIGVWPAIWTLGTNIKDLGWPVCGEIDILEFVGYDPTHIHANIHTRKYNHMNGNNIGSKLVVKKPWEDFHVYAIEWYPDHIDFFFDDIKYFSCSDPGEGVDAWPFKDAAQYLLINLAIGGSWGGEQGIDDSIFPQEFIFEYVRIYEIKE
ncbi:MAG: glycoside hydrolase family 16 protein [Bacteroidales bacterium]|nr:glycoside hydrolase family 16 protein [Bacteroidales bacterium]